jgi:hypothetical protein
MVIGLVVLKSTVKKMNTVHIVHMTTETQKCVALESEYEDLNLKLL